MKGVHRYGAICLASLTALTQAPVATAGDDGVLAIVAASALIVSQVNESAGSDSDEITFVPSIGYQHKRMKFEQEYNLAAGGGTADFDVDLPTINVSLTAGYKRMFLTAKFEKNVGDTTTEADEIQPATPTYYLNIPGGLTSVDRKDMSLTLGYNIVSTLNLFVGYMKGETNLKPEIGCVFVDPEFTCDPGTNPAGLSNLAFLHNYYGTRASSYEQEYTEDGPFVGLSYAWQISDIGVLSFSSAYAKMDGEYKDNYAPVFEPSFDPLNPLDFKYTGDSTGTSFGLTWTAPLGESSNYFIDIRQQKYDMDADDDTGSSAFVGASVKTEETMKGLTAGVQFYF